MPNKKQTGQVGNNSITPGGTEEFKETTQKKAISPKESEVKIKELDDQIKYLIRSVSEMQQKVEMLCGETNPPWFTKWSGVLFARLSDMGKNPTLQSKQTQPSTQTAFSQETEQQIFEIANSTAKIEKTLDELSQSERISRKTASSLDVDDALRKLQRHVEHVEHVLSTQEQNSKQLIQVQQELETQKMALRDKDQEIYNERNRCQKSLKKFWEELEVTEANLRRRIERQGLNCGEALLRKQLLTNSLELLEKNGAEILLRDESLGFLKIGYDGVEHKWGGSGSPSVEEEQSVTVFMPGWRMGDEITVKPVVGVLTEEKA